MRTIRGKKALVTGAASGIGRSIALALADEGADLFLLDIAEEGLAAVAEEGRGRGVEVVVRHCDVAEEQQIADSVSALVEAWGKLDILVNNAGIVYYGRTERMKREQWERILAVNLLAPTRFIRILLPILRQQPEAHILNVCSLAGLVPARRFAAYQTSKSGLVGLSRSLRAEYSPRGIGVTALCPGFVDTGMLGSAIENGYVTSKPRVPSRWTTSSAYIAAQAIHAIRKNKGLVVPTLYARILWYLDRLSPSLLDAWIHYKYRKK